jgi:hypothetical protein
MNDMIKKKVSKGSSTVQYGLHTVTVSGGSGFLLLLTTDEPDGDASFSCRDTVDDVDDDADSDRLDDGGDDSRDEGLGREKRWCGCWCGWWRWAGGGGDWEEGRLPWE